MFVVALLSSFFLLGKVRSETKVIANSCSGLDDGTYYLKLLEDPDSDNDYPVIKQKCSNGYIMLDYSMDSDISQYFSSFLKWHYSIGGPSQDEHINLKEWYLPDDRNTKYLVSDSCDTCDESIQQYTTNGYYMNANLFGCFVFPRGMPVCDFDIDTYECHACHTSQDFSLLYRTEFGAANATTMGACMTWVREASADVDRTFDECTAQTETGWKPTIGLSGKFCLCVQPSTVRYYEVDESLLTAKDTKLEEAATKASEEASAKEQKLKKGYDYQTKLLYAKDFEAGTLRIQEPGTYKLMEDITFDWNAGDISGDPNSFGSWWPNENDETHPGWGDTRDQYFMGYFAGITIESDDVLLDLNGHSLQQSKAFFYQQGFFSDIEIQSQPFIPGQGIGFFGSDPVFPANVIIKNGVLGRASHHCIHGNYNKNLLIEDITCSEFSTHGIQLNGFDGVVIRNVEVGPANTEQYLASEYTHYRFVLANARKVLEEENPTGTILFSGRNTAVSLADLVDKLDTEMNYAIQYVMLGQTPEDENDEEWIEAKKLFINPSGVGYGASIYGIFLSYPGANVLSYHINSGISHNATLENVYIHDINHKTKEYVGMRTDVRVFVNSFNAPLSLEYLLGDKIFNQYVEEGGEQSFENGMRYRGNILTDITVALHELSDNWGRLQIMYLLTDELVAWAKGEDSVKALGNADNDEISYLCGFDGMIHSAKGTFGIRIDAVDTVTLKDVTIENLVENSALGYEMCGECTRCAFEARTPYQIGYAGNMVQGISADYVTNMQVSNLEIRNVESKTGRAIGFSVWPGTEVTFSDSIVIENIVAGNDVEEGTLEYTSRPNAAPEACGIRVYDEVGYSDSDSDHDFAVVTIADSAKINTYCVSGHSTCWGSDLSTQLGDYSCSEDSDNVATYNTKSSNQFIYNLLFACVALISIVLFWKYYINKRKTIQNVEVNNEVTPLIHNNKNYSTSI